MNDDDTGISRKAELLQERIGTHSFYPSVTEASEDWLLNCRHNPFAFSS
jgi:hypothetical protein